MEGRCYVTDVPLAPGSLLSSEGDRAKLVQNPAPETTRCDGTLWGDGQGGERDQKVRLKPDPKDERPGAAPPGEKACGRL